MPDIGATDLIIIQVFIKNVANLLIIFCIRGIIPKKISIRREKGTTEWFRMKKKLSLHTLMKKKVLFIMNPISGTAGKKLILEHIEQLLSRERFDWTVAATQYAGHASVLTREAVEQGTDIVVAIGGDGTVNEVARSLIHTPAALGIIPCGSGNGLARHLEIPLEPRKAIEVLNRCIIREMDYGKINGQPFFCTCGVGFDAFVSFKFAMAGKRGLLTYLENTLREGLRYKPDTYEIEDEEGIHKLKAFLIACANASQYGNNAYIAPQASMSDGLLDVTVMEPFTVLDAPQIAFQLFNKTITQNSHIKTFRTRKLCIRREKPGVIHYDGEPVMTGRDIEVEAVSKGLHVVVHEEAQIAPKDNILSVFSAYFNDLESIGGTELKARSKRFLVVNRELLRKLTKK